MDIEIIRQCYQRLEKQLREADDELDRAPPGQKREARRRRCAINDACNALYRGFYDKGLS